MSSPANVAGMLGAYRLALSPGRDAPTTLGVELLLWIASGVDHAADLAKLSGLSAGEVWRQLLPLRGRGRRSKGQIIHSAVCLVQTRKHPHRKGHELSLSPQGQELVDSTFELPNTTRYSATAD